MKMRFWIAKRNGHHYVVVSIGSVANHRLVAGSACRDLPRQVPSRKENEKMMKKCLLTGTIAMFACCSLFGLAQEGTKPATTKATKAETSGSKAEAEKKGRLPSQYGKLGLSDAQRQKIYGLQAQYDDQLDALEKQFAALKAKRDQEIEAVLNDSQRKVLSTLVEAAKNSKKTKAPADGGKTTGSSSSASEAKTDKN
jgi:hypothetical protein